ncbi:MAG: ImmA/IrrE family metallo-endopeptidase [Magnetococcales bacterium]|nr:ImmA/IrrE family metallo-endopeptidase [Magnetococcales bacterium]
MNLKELRQTILGFRLETVHRYTGIPLDRLERIENGEAPDIAEIESMALVYGISPEVLAEDPIRVLPQDGVHLLARNNEFQEWNEHIRHGIVKIHNAAKDLARLRSMVPADGDRVRPGADLPPLPVINNNSPPWQQGRELAQAFRTYFCLGEEPLPSVRDLALDVITVTLLYCKLGADGPAGLTFANSQEGAVLALNMDGKNTNPTARRVSLAHELCHYWIDWRRPDPLATLSGYLSDRKKEIEQRANAFAIRLLCPESVVQRHLDKSNDAEKTAEYLIKEFGLPYSAARNYLSHTCGRTIPVRPVPGLRVGIDQCWQDCEAPAGVADFPLPEVSVERRTFVARHAAYLYAERHIQRDFFAEMLGVPPSAALEMVLDFFDTDPPMLPDHA